MIALLLCCCTVGLSLVAVSGGYSLAVVRGLLIAAAFVAKNMLCSVGSVVAACRVSWPGAREIFPDQRSHPCPLHWQVNYLPLET